MSVASSEIGKKQKQNGVALLEVLTDLQEKSGLAFNSLVGLAKAEYSLSVEAFWQSLLTAIIACLMLVVFWVACIAALAISTFWLSSSILVGVVTFIVGIALSCYILITRFKSLTSSIGFERTARELQHLSDSLMASNTGEDQAAKA